jgi:hypothetical protein
MTLNQSPCPRAVTAISRTILYRAAETSDDARLEPVISRNAEFALELAGEPRMGPGLLQC